MAVEFILLDCCPVPKPLYPILKKLKKQTGCTYGSIYRGTDAEAMLAKCGKHDQKYLYEHQGEPGIGPANPPGFSTHELYSDGVAYPAVARGGKLAWWQCGMDVDDAHVQAFIDQGAKDGWTPFRPYGTGSEWHHVNFKTKPARWKLFYWHVFGGRKP